MKVVHLVGGSIKGGAARGAYVLHKGLLKIGVESSMLVDGPEELDDSSIQFVQTTYLQRFLSKVRRKVEVLPICLYSNRDSRIFSTGFGGKSILNHPLVKNADVVNLHWINFGFISLKTIKKIEKPLVWTVRDMWPITGGCHFSLDCDRFKTGCGQCPQLGSKNKFDLSRLIFNYKLKAVHSANITGVGIGSWITELIRESPTFSGKDVRMISNAIDIDQFNPLDKNFAKQYLGLDDRKVVLIGASNPSSFYKGMPEAIECLKILINKGVDFQLITFGTACVEFQIDGLDVKQLGILDSNSELSVAYSAADVFLAPSKAETFGKTLAESMACGTPVVAFDATGPTDIIDHKLNGYLAIPYSPDDLANGVMWLLSRELSEMRTIKLQAMDKVKSNFSPIGIAGKYRELYEKLI